MNYNQGLSVRPNETSSVKFRDIYSSLASQTSTSSEASRGSGFQPEVPETSSMAQVQEANMSALWQGMTLKKILEEVDLSSMFLDEESKKDQASKNSSNGNVNPESAFLGPRIWSRPAISMPSITGGTYFLNKLFGVLKICKIFSQKSTSIVLHTYVLEGNHCVLYEYILYNGPHSSSSKSSQFLLLNGIFYVKNHPKMYFGNFNV